MLSLKVGDTIYLSRGEATVFDKVSKLLIGSDVDGNSAVIKVYLAVIDEWFQLVPSSSYEAKYNAIWEVDEVNGNSPDYILDEVEVI
jgi:hypothetical protein